MRAGDSTMQKCNLMQWMHCFAVGVKLTQQKRKFHVMNASLLLCQQRPFLLNKEETSMLLRQCLGHVETGICFPSYEFTASRRQFDSPLANANRNANSFPASSPTPIPRSAGDASGFDIRHDLDDQHLTRLFETVIDSLDMNQPPNTNTMSLNLENSFATAGNLYGSHNHKGKTRFLNQIRPLPFNKHVCLFAPYVIHNTMKM